MDILFVNAQDTMALKNEVNGQLLLGTLLLQAGFDVDVLRFCQIDGFKGEYADFVQNAVHAIVALDPKAVSFYSLWPDHHIMLRIARELKTVREDIHVIFAGPQSSATAREILGNMPFVDMVCTGEGEETVVPFFTALLRNGGKGLKEVPGLYFRDNGTIKDPTEEVTLCDLNTLPQWDDRLYLKHYQNSGENYTSQTYYMPIDAGRGCPFKCSFCYANAVRKRSYRLKSPERIVADIRFFKEKFGITSFWFTHDAYTTNMKLVEKVCDYIIEEKLNITWRCTARMDCISKELIAKMKRAGLTGIEVGVETGSPRMQRLINKNLDLDMVKENARHVLGENIALSTFFMYGFPEETEEDLFRTVQLALDLIDAGVNYASMSLCRFNPTTNLTGDYLDQLVLDPSMDVLAQGIFGYQSELTVITENRRMFSYFYNLETPLRRKYQHLKYLLDLYQKLSASRHYLRQAFDFDAAKLVNAFLDGTAECFAGGVDSVLQWMSQQPQELLCNTVDQLHQPWGEQLKALIQFDIDQHKLKKSKKEYVHVGEYSFCYDDLKKRLPIVEYRKGSSSIVMQKKDGKIGVMLLKSE